jgi:hypothetical protein
MSQEERRRTHNWKSSSVTVAGIREYGGGTCNCRTTPRDLPDLRQGAKAQGCVCIMNEKYLFFMWGESNKNRS